MLQNDSITIWWDEKKMNYFQRVIIMCEVFVCALYMAKWLYVEQSNFFMQKIEPKRFNEKKYCSH